MLETLWGMLWTLELWFRRPVEPDAIYAAVGLVGTAAALFFTLALLPAQLHYSAGMSEVDPVFWTRRIFAFRGSSCMRGADHEQEEREAVYA